MTDPRATIWTMAAVWRRKRGLIATVDAKERMQTQTVRVERTPATTSSAVCPAALWPRRSHGSDLASAAPPGAPAEEDWAAEDADGGGFAGTRDGGGEGGGGVNNAARPFAPLVVEAGMVPSSSSSSSPASRASRAPYLNEPGPPSASCSRGAKMLRTLWRPRGGVVMGRHGFSTMNTMTLARFAALAAVLFASSARGDENPSCQSWAGAHGCLR